jgi:sugar/nucleoside kinase (ribokinase family)
MFDLAYADIDFEYLFSARHLHLSSYFLHRALRPHIADIFRQAKSKGLSTSLDTNDDPEDKWGEDLAAVLPFVDIFFPNEREAKKIAGTADLPSALAKLSQLCRLVVVKRGAEGAVAREGSREWRAASVPVHMVDPVGAGDSFDAGYIHKFLQGANREECLAFAGATGAFSITCAGGIEAFRDRAKLAEFLRLHRPSPGN